MSGRALPASPPPARKISLDTLLARTAPAPRPAARPAVRSNIVTEDDSLQPWLGASKADRPTALILPITLIECACGSVQRVCSAYVLARYEANGHSFRYQRAELDATTLALPREKREHHLSIPFCEECF